MSSTKLKDGRGNLAGAVWMTGAMALFAVEDALLKASASGIPVGQVLFLFGLGGSLLFAIIAKGSGEALFTRDVVSRPMLIRAVFEVFGRLFYTLAYVLTPLSSVTVILQAAPLVVVAGAALIFGEDVEWRRWIAIAIGLIGVVVVLQPGVESFSILSLLAIFGMIGFAGRDLASRVAPPSLSVAVLGFHGFMAMILAGGLIALWWGQPFVMPGLKDSALIAIACVIGAAGYGCLMKAMRLGEVSAVAPFRYTRLIFGVALGIFVFGEALTWPMLVGSGLIVLSGLFILWRGHRHDKTA
ncbi:MAG: DMT family transporter [Pseudomonadota bacterium]